MLDVILQLYDMIYKQKEIDFISYIRKIYNRIYNYNNLII